VSAELPILSLSVTSAGAIGRGRGVTFAGAQVSAAGAKPLGIARAKANAAGFDLPLTVSGVAVCEAGGAIAQGAAVAMDAQGRVVTASAVAIAAGGTAMTSTAANGAGVITGGELPQYVVGDALTEATAAGQFIEVVLRR
jgi:hypothetical protein